MFIDLDKIAHSLTKIQRHCIVALTDDWDNSNYSKVVANLIWATSSDFYPGRYDPLIERRVNPADTIHPLYQHRLTQLGEKVKEYLCTYVMIHDK